MGVTVLRVQNRIEFSGLFAFIIIMLMWGLATVSLDRRDPLPNGFDKAAVLNSPIPLGGYLDARVWRTKVRDDCTLAAKRWATDQNGNYADIPSEVLAVGLSSSEYLDIRYDVSELAVGEWVVFVDLTYSCPGVGPFEHSQPPLRFTIVDPSAKVTIEKLERQLDEIQRALIPTP